MSIRSMNSLGKPPSKLNIQELSRQSTIGIRVIFRLNNLIKNAR